MPDMSQFETIENLRDHLAEEQIMVVSLQELREALDYKKLGPRVLIEIAQKLSGQGLGYFPRETIDNNAEPRAWEEVRVYLKDSPLGKVVQSVLDPTESGDTYLLELADVDNSAAEMLDAIRKVLGE
jgi:hypothetical protein